MKTEQFQNKASWEYRGFTIVKITAELDGYYFKICKGKESFSSMCFSSIISVERCIDTYLLRTEFNNNR